MLSFLRTGMCFHIKLKSLLYVILEKILSRTKWDKDGFKGKSTFQESFSKPTYTLYLPAPIQAPMSSTN